MKIMNILTLRYLKANKKRSLLTLLCIMVSVIMMSSVGIAFSSGKDYYKRYIEKTKGDYHYYLFAPEKEVVDLIVNDPLVDEYYLSSAINFDYQNSTFNILSGNQGYFQKRNMNDYLIEGRLPINQYELVISKDFLKQNHVNKAIGDTITFDDQYTYKIVGFMKTYKSYLDIYQALTYVDENQPYFLYVKDKDTSSRIFEHTKQLENQIKKIRHIDTDVDDFGLVYNSSYLAIQDIFEENSTSSVLKIYNMIYILIGVISFVSIFIIYQAFHLSTSDRIQYLGMLSSVGATPKQKKRSVYFEGFVLSLIAIPLGIIVSYIGLSITFHIANEMELLKNTGIQLHTQISLFYMFCVILLSLLTIAIALYIPARKISKISVMDALRKSDEIKVKKKKLKLNRFLEKYLSIQWKLSLKNYKRQGRRSQIIIFSLVLSMGLFVTVFSFSQLFLKTITGDNKKVYEDVLAYVSLDDVERVNQILDYHDHLNYYFIANNSVYADIDPSYLQYQDESNLVSVTAIDQKNYEKICQENDIVPQKNQALIYNRPIDIINDGEEKTYSKPYKKMDKNFIKNVYFEEYDGEKSYQRKLENFDSIELLHTSDNYGITTSYDITLLVPIEYYKNNFTQDFGITYYIQTDEATQVCEEINALGIETTNILENRQQSMQLIQIIQIFVYGFVSIIVFFTLLNILNMMSASIEKRKQELAMLMSVGMSYLAIKKMLLIESLIYGIKTLIYGTPLCLLLEYIIFQSSEYMGQKFVPSWLAYIISFIVVLLVMILTFQIGLSRFRKQNIVETLKDDM